MANNDYQMLINLRNNIVALPEARKAYENAKKDLAQCRFEPSPRESDRMYEEYKREYIGTHNSEFKRNKIIYVKWRIINGVFKFLSRLAIFLLFVLFCGAVCGTVYLLISKHIIACIVCLAISIWLLCKPLEKINRFNMQIKIRRIGDSIGNELLKKRVEPDMSILLQSERYRAAEARDKEQLEADKQHYEQVKNEKQMIVNKYWSVLTQCEKAIQNAPIHPSYKNIKMLDNLLYYFNYNRASTLIEAVNQYTHDQQMQAYMNKIDSMRSDMNANHFAFMREMEQSRKMNEAHQNDVSKQLQAIQREAEKTAYYTKRISDWM